MRRSPDTSNSLPDPFSFSHFANFEAGHAGEQRHGLELVAPAERILRLEQAREAVAQLLRTNAPAIAITGRPGVGRSAFISEMATVAQRTGMELELHVMTLTEDDPAAQVIKLVGHLSTEHSTGVAVLVIDDLDQMGEFNSAAWQINFIEFTRIHAADHGLGFVFIIDDRSLATLADTYPMHAEKLCRIHLDPLPADELAELVANEAETLAHTAKTRVTVPHAVIEHALSPAAPSEAHQHPGLALARIDAAIARAKVDRVTKSLRLRTDHLALSTQPVTRSATELRALLSSVIRGQENAVRVVSERLAPALQGLSLRPERPYGVFLFAGPSGCGKSELAKQLATAVYGSEQALITLDMSEYREQNDGLMKLIGSHRTWKNSTRDGLLTTRVIEQPRTVLLLDEFEKAHPSLWNVFLQVFDEGRLSDGWGQAASFAETTIILTSNLGARAGEHRSAGFGAPTRFNSDRQLEEIKRVIPPELLGRITETVCFDPLDDAAILQLAHDELERLARRLKKTGWDLKLTAEVPIWLATRDRDPALGARHLQTNIERDLLPLLTSAPSRSIRVTVNHDQLQTKATTPGEIGA